MPIDTRTKPYVAATVPACRAVIAARLHAPERERHVLRRLRVRHFSRRAARRARDDRRGRTRRRRRPRRARALGAGRRRQRRRSRRTWHARASRSSPRACSTTKLANWSGGRRYTCPSYEIVRRSDGVRIAVPGFQPFAVYDVILANLVPGLRRNEPPESVAEVLEWTGTPLAIARGRRRLRHQPRGRARAARPRRRRAARRLRRLLDAGRLTAAVSRAPPAPRGEAVQVRRGPRRRPAGRPRRTGRSRPRPRATPSARAQAMSRGVSPTTTVRSRGHGRRRSRRARRARARSPGRSARSSLSEPKPP